MCGLYLKSEQRKGYRLFFNRKFKINKEKNTDGL